jgi:hypothetical protein
MDMAVFWIGVPLMVVSTAMNIAYILHQAGVL